MKLKLQMKKTLTEKNILSELKKPTSDRILKVAQALDLKRVKGNT